MTDKTNLPDELLIEINNGDPQYGEYNVYDPNGLCNQNATRYIRKDLTQQPTDEAREEALEVFDAIIEVCEIEAECRVQDLLNNMPVDKAIETIRAALIQAQVYSRIHC